MILGGAGKDLDIGEALQDHADVMASYVIEAPDQDQEVGDCNPVVVAESTARLKSLSVSAAVIELDLSGAPVLVFRHAGSAQVNVLYRRPDGHIGWIDPSNATRPTSPARARPPARDAACHAPCARAGIVCACRIG